MAMAARPQTPVQDAYSFSQPHEPSLSNRGYGTVRSSSRPSSYAGGSAFHHGYGALGGLEPAQIPQNPRFKEDFDAASRRSSILLDGPSAPGLQRSASTGSPARSAAPPLKNGGTLKKKASLSKRGSLRRNGSRRSVRAGSVKSLSLGDREKYNDEDMNSAFVVPIPTTGNPTEVLANRFQGELGTCCHDFHSFPAS